MNKIQFIHHPADGETLNGDNLLTTEYPQFHDDWMYNLFNPNIQVKGQTYLYCIAKNP